MTTVQVPPLVEILAAIPDPRQEQGRRHSLAGMLALACVATLCGYASVKAIAEWGRNYGDEYAAAFGFERHGYPAQATWYRVLRQVDLHQVEAHLGSWCEQVLAALGRAADLEGLSVDGQTLRGSRQHGAEGAHLLGAATHGLGSVLAQVAVADHTNEIGVFAALVVNLVLTGRVVTTDALLTQTEVAATIRERGGEYLMPVKANQPATLEALTYWFEGHPPRPLANRVATRVEKGHGRLTEWRIEVTSALNDYLAWPDLAQCFKLTCRRTDLASGTAHTQTHYGITSLTPDHASPADLLRLKRQHWTIENRVHWVRDVTFHEDRNALHTGHTHQLLAALRNLTLTILRSLGHANIAAALRSFAARPALALSLLTEPLPIGE